MGALTRAMAAALLTPLCAGVHPQVAKQEGEYLASALIKGQWDQEENTFKLPEKSQPFK
jgi:hypothetical protein